jgi:hypothetical protein
MGPDYILAFETTPASLQRLTIEYDPEVYTEGFYSMVELIRSRIKDLAVWSAPEEADGQLLDFLVDFPNLFHLNVAACYVFGHSAHYRRGDVYQSLRSITISLYSLEDIFHCDFLEGLEDLVDKDWLPNVRSLVFSSEFTKDPWVSFLREQTVPQERNKLLCIDRRLKPRSSSASGLRESGLWLVDGSNDDDVVCQVTERELARVMHGAPVYNRLGPEEIENHGCEGQSQLGGTLPSVYTE